MDGGGKAAGRARVARLLWDRLDAAGMRPPARQKAEAHAVMRERLTARLAYLSDANLMTLAEVVIDQGGGAAHDRMPGEASILGLARGLQAEPVAQKRIVTSWLASIEGPKALAAGHEVALFRFLRRTGRPPMPFDLTRIAEQAREDRRRVELIEDRIARDVAAQDDRDWLSAWLRDRELVRGIVAEGAARRDGEADDAA